MKKSGESPECFDSIFLGYCAAVFATTVFCVIEPFFVFVLIASAHDPAWATQGGHSNFLSMFTLRSFARSVEMSFAGFVLISYFAFLPCFFATLLVCAVVGMPVHFFLEARKLRSLKSYIATGVLASLLLLPIFSGIFSPFQSSFLFVVPDLMICGPLAAAAFWSVARPDRHLVEPAT